MADDAVYDACKAYLQDAATVERLRDPDTNQEVPGRFENEAFNTPAGPWYAMALSGVGYAQASIGAENQADNVWDEDGHLWLTVFVPSGEGSSRARRIAKTLADLFRGKQLLGGNLEFFDARIGTGSPSEEDGNWYEIPVLIEWRRAEA